MSHWVTEEIPAGQTFYTVFEHRYAANAFNPNHEADPGRLDRGGRFHPFLDDSDAPVPTKYVADHPHGAIAEVLMRDDRANKSVSVADVEACSLALVRFTVPVTVIDLSHTTLNGRLDPLLAEGQSAYRPLRDLAATLYRDHPGVSGLRWDGKQLGIPGMRCLMLFGDRLAESQIEVVEEGRLGENSALEHLRKCAVHREFRLPKKFIA